MINLRNIVVFLCCWYLSEVTVAANAPEDVNSEDVEPRASGFSVSASSSSSSIGGHGEGAKAQVTFDAVINSPDNTRHDLLPHESFPPKTPANLPLKRPMPYGLPAKDYIPNRHYGKHGNGQSYYGNDQPVQPHTSGGIAPALPLAYRAETCRYWCRNAEHADYCCETVNEKPSRPVGTKPGFCPVVRQSCPTIQARSRPQRPRPCAHDGACLGADKCCFDRCQQRHICKPPLNSPYSRKV